MKQIAAFFLAGLLWLAPAHAEEHPENSRPFSEWLQEFKRDAMAEGIRQEVLDAAFADTQPIDRVIELDQKQPETTVTLAQYLRNTVTDKRVKEGRELYEEHAGLLKRI